LKDEKDTLVSKAIDVVDPTAGDVWDAYSLSGDLDDTVTLYKPDGEFAGTFQLGQFLANLISSFGQKVTAGTPGNDIRARKLFPDTNAPSTTHVLPC
jgi:hypothetical protein